MTNGPNVNSNGPGAKGNRQDEQKGGDVQALTEALRDAVAALGGIRSDNVPESVRAALSSPSLALQPVEPPTLPFRGFVRHAPSADAPRVTNFAAPPPAAVPAQPAEPMVGGGLSDESLMFTNPMYDDKFKLEYAKGAIKFRNDIIANLRHRLAAPPNVGAQPADRAEPAPLTDAQIVAIRDEHLPNQGDSFDCIAFARAILATRSQP